MAAVAVKTWLIVRKTGTAHVKKKLDIYNYEPQRFLLFSLIV